MKNIHYYIVTLVVLLFMVAPAKAASEANSGNCTKRTSCILTVARRCVYKRN